MPTPGSDEERTSYGVVASRQFTSGPPAALYTDEDGEVFETVKEEEVVHRRRKATTTTKNIERRTQRDILLEDGKVVGDTGPTVTEDVTEDTQVKETFADENLKPEGQHDAVAALPPGEGWVAVPGSLVTSEKVEKYVNSRQEQEDIRETEQEAHYGDVTNEEVERYKGDVGQLSLAAQHRQESAGTQVALTEPRLVHESRRQWGVVDTEDLKETSRIKDGHVVTDTKRTTQQEQYDHGSAPHSGSSISDGSVQQDGHKAHHHLVHTKDEDILEYYAVPKGGTLAQGVKLGEGMHVVNEDLQEDREGDAPETVGLLRHRVGPLTTREDALTKKPLDYIKEERQRQHETTRWLEHHFGSDSGRSRDSEEETGCNRIKITMAPHRSTPPPTPPEGPLRRWGPMSSTPVRSTPPPPKSPVTTNNRPPAPPMPHQISEARSRLRSTGRTLDELDSGRDMYNPGRVRNDSYNFSQNSGSGVAFTPPISPTSPTSFNTGYTNGRYQPPVMMENNYLTNVGRSQSFHTTNLERNNSNIQYNNETNGRAWHERTRSPQPAAPPRQAKNRPFSGHFSTLQNTKKKFDKWTRKEEENLDDSFRPSPSKGPNDKWREQQLNSKYSREIENERPKSSIGNGHVSRNADYSNHGSTQFSAKMAGKISQSQNKFDNAGIFSANGEAPVPPPRTKRRVRPQTTYFFGQPSSATSSKQRPASIYANMSFNTSPSRKHECNNDDYYNSNFNKTNKVTKSTSFLNNQNTYNDENNYNNTYSNKNNSRSRSESYNNKFNDNAVMNRKNERYNNQGYAKKQPYSNNREVSNGYGRLNGRDYSNENEYSHDRDLSNDRYDSGYGDRQETYGRQRDGYYSKTEDRSDRRSSNEKRHDERTSKKITDEKRRNSRKSSKEDNVERRYKTTKTITPVFVMETKQPKQYRSMDVLNTSPNRNSLYTQTLETRKKKMDHNLRESSTLPRKVHQTNFSMPSKTYIYGTDEKVNKNHIYTNGSTTNITSQNGYEHPTPILTNGNSSKHILRSQSMSVRPVTNLSSLRSPNLIASIARTSSTRRPETQSTEDLLSRDVYEHSRTQNSYPRAVSPEEKTEEKKSLFMEGLLNTAPELFHFIHGEGEDTVDNRKTADSPPRLIRPPGSASPSPAPLNAPKVFTFGREGGNTLRRGSSGSNNDLNASNPNINKLPYSTNSMSRPSSGYDSGTYSSNSIKRTGSAAQDGNRRQSTFNMKTQGGSLLYSPSFRERSQQMLQEKQRMKLDAEMAGKRARENTPILIQVRDWDNSR